MTKETWWGQIFGHNHIYSGNIYKHPTNENMISSKKKRHLKLVFLMMSKVNQKILMHILNAWKQSIFSEMKIRSYEINNCNITTLSLMNIIALNIAGFSVNTTRVENQGLRS